jgi:hypothetical protein
VLYLAREDEPARHRGTVVRIAASPFAPSTRLLQDVGNGAIDGPAFARRYLRELRGLWEHDQQPFLDLIALASGEADCTLVDAWAEERYAPRRILGAALKQLATTRQHEAKRTARRAAPQTPRRAPPAAP